MGMDALALSSRTDRGASRMLAAATLSVASLLAAFSFCVDLAGDIRFAPRTRHSTRAPAAVTHAGEAVSLVQEWRLAGDDKSIVQRLAGAVLNPYYARAWSFEKTEEGAYLVLFREPAGTPVYAFEVDSQMKSVRATPETVDRLTILRVRDEAQSRSGLLASAH